MGTTTTTFDRETTPRANVKCFHCGTGCRSGAFSSGDKSFCCQGCRMVFELLSESGLNEFYALSSDAGVRVKATHADQFKYLDALAVRERLVDFQDDRVTRVTFHIPAIHCIACVWLLENLFRLNAGIGESKVNFPRKELAITFTNSSVLLSEVVALLASLGYGPELKFSDLNTAPRAHTVRRLWMQIGLAGFAFGNLMLLAIANYFGLDAFSGPTFRRISGVISLVLALPVITYSAQDYWRAAWRGLRRKLLTIEVPIAAGLIAIFVQSSYEVWLGRGAGYFDSLCGLIFFLLCGKLFQQKTFDRLSFERDYKSFFPLAITRLERRPPARLDDNVEHAGSETGASVERSVALSEIRAGDRLLIRHGELIPADARLVSGVACIDYSFVTGESEPVSKSAGDHLYAGGRQTGGAIEIETVKAVSQSYLTSLWNQDAFRKDKGETLESLTNLYSFRFTKIVIVIAVGAALFWVWSDAARAVKAFASVLIVACPCALALAAPFTLGTALRVLGRRGVFVKSPAVIEALAKVNTIVFDKTGTLTKAGAVEFQGEPLTESEQRQLNSLARQSTHPLAVRVAESLADAEFAEPVRSFMEIAGAGIEGTVGQHEILMGSAVWIGNRLAPEGPNMNSPRCNRGTTRPTSINPEGVEPKRARFAPSNSTPTGSESPADSHPRLHRGLFTFNPSGIEESDLIKVSGSTVHVAMDGRYRGCFALAGALRPETERLIRTLSQNHELSLLSGDNERERVRFTELFGQHTALRFHQSPLDKLEFIHGRQRAGRTVMMVGDGLNDAGALQQSDVGVAVVERVGAFSPASYIILSATMVPQLDTVLHFSKSAVRIVKLSFLLSSFYNVIGLSIAASGLLSPVVCAILMPVSSITVVAFACGTTAWAGRKLEAA
jgi:Cu+-exporting ATPase